MSDDERMREGVEHVQAAALELIAAARVALDLAERAVREPGELVARAAAAAELVRLAASRVSGGVTRSAASCSPAPGRGHVGSGGHDEDDRLGGDSGVERIRVL